MTAAVKTSLSFPAPADLPKPKVSYSRAVSSAKQEDVNNTYPGFQSLQRTQVFRDVRATYRKNVFGRKPRSILLHPDPRNEMLVTSSLDGGVQIVNYAYRDRNLMCTIPPSITQNGWAEEMVRFVYLYFG